MLPMTTLDSTLGRYLQLVWDRGASDLHLTAGYPPVLRIDGQLVPIEGEQRLMPPDVARMIRSMFTEDHWAVYLEKKQLDFSFSYQGLGRFRGNAYQQRGAAALALRGIPYGIKTLEDFATCADWELAGGYTTSAEGKRVKDDGLLEKFDMSLEEAQTLIMSARVQLGWVDAADLEAAADGEAAVEAEAGSDEDAARI